VEKQVANPAILAVDDDPGVLRAVENDLRRQYGRDYRVLRANSGALALDLLRRLKLRGGRRLRCCWSTSACLA
jgi:thioredoxin reductase (NADPH)